MATDNSNAGVNRRVVSGKVTPYVGPPAPLTYESAAPANAQNDDKNAGVNRRVVSGKVTPYVAPSTSKNTTQSAPPTKSNGTKPTNETGQKHGTKPGTNSDSNIRTITPRSNPLSRYSSYTYNLSLYIATPEALNDFIDTGQFDPTNNFFLIAQSGGIGSEEKRGITLGDKLGPNQPGYDYYIDDLDIKFALTGTDGTPTVGAEMRFKIIESIGFNFFNDLEQLSGKVNELSDIIKGSESKPPPISQNFIIGIRFYGYDENGNIATADSFQYKNTFFKQGLLESKSNVSKYATYERFFSFQISKVNYQIDGKIVTYQIEGTPLDKQIGQGTKFGLIDSQSSIIAGSVKEALEGMANKASSNTSRGLIQIANEEQIAKQKANLAKSVIKYSVIWGKGTEELQKSTVVNAPTAENASTSTVKKTNESTPKAAEQATQSGVNTGKKTITVPAGASLIMMMDQIMLRSSYVSKTLIAKNNDAIETISTKTDAQNVEAELQWYTINPVVKVTGRDSITKDWSYTVDYHIEMQKIQYLKAYYKPGLSKFFGPQKRYDFFYTGKNTEILSFEQSYNNQFYILQALGAGKGIVNKNNSTTAHARGGVTAVQMGGETNKQNEIAANTAVRLNSVADQSEAQIKILGDPDYLMTNIGGLRNGTTNSGFQQTYNVDANTMNPYRGQIWIEIVFKGANDYKENGTLNTLDVDFYKMINNVEDKNKKIEGMIYRITEIGNLFSNGRFSQDLKLIMVGENDLRLSEEIKENIRNDKKTTNTTGNNYLYQRAAGPTAEELAAYHNSKRVPRRGGTPNEIRRNVYVARGNPSEYDDDQTLENKRENQRLLSRARTKSDEVLNTVLPGGNRRTP